MQALRTAGHLVQTRGQVKGTGRGQTHKVRIIELWLDRQGYDKIAPWAHHSVQSIKRYVSTFLRIVTLHRQATAVSEIAFLAAASEKLVGDYLALYARTQGAPVRLAKLEEELARAAAWRKWFKKGDCKHEPHQPLRQYRKAHLPGRIDLSFGDRIPHCRQPSHPQSAGRGCRGVGHGILPADGTHPERPPDLDLHRRRGPEGATGQDDRGLQDGHGRLAADRAGGAGRPHRALRPHAGRRAGACRLKRQIARLVTVAAEQGGR